MHALCGQASEVGR